MNVMEIGGSKEYGAEERKGPVIHINRSLAKWLWFIFTASFYFEHGYP